MKAIQQTLQNAVAAMKSSPLQSCRESAGRKQTPIRKTDKGNLELSAYNDEQPDERQIAVCVKRLQTAFPAMQAGFFSILVERILQTGFTSRRLEDATNHVIDNFRYKELNIADVISFDKRVKLYTGKEFVTEQSKGVHPSEFEERTIDGVLYWVKKADLLNEKYL